LYGLSYPQYNSKAYLIITASKPVRELPKKIIKKIINRVSILESYPLAGQKEEILNEYPENFRYLVESNYKIIYWEKDLMITIASVFDCRQDPEKINKI
jgi:hypothetical protein